MAEQFDLLVRGGTLVDGVSTLTVTNGLTSITGSGGTFDGAAKTYSAGNSFVRATVTSSSSHSTAVTQTPNVNGISDVFSVTTLAAVSPIISGPSTANAVELTSLSIGYTITNRDGETPTLTGADSGLFSINNTGGDSYTLDKTTDTGTAGTEYNVTINIDDLTNPAVTLPVVITCVAASVGGGSQTIGIKIGIGI